MDGITVILTTYRRPHALLPQVEAVRAQTVAPTRLWVWANEPADEMASALAGAGADRVVSCSANALFHARFGLALTAPTEYVAVFDDDAVPGPGWFANCLATMRRTPGILGTAGVCLRGAAYRGRTVHGWASPSTDVVEVDLVGHAWFLRTEWVRHLFAAPPVLGTNGEDIELAARAWRLAGVHCFCPPHPPGDRNLWGSLRGEELGGDAAAASRREAHLDERDWVVRAEIEAGWRPLFQRGPSAVATALLGPAALGPGGDGRGDAVAPDVLNLVPASAASVLVLGRGSPRLAAALKERGFRRVCVLAADEGTARQARRHADQVWVTDPDRGLPGEPERFGCVLCDGLDELRDAAGLLRRIRGRLESGGLLVAAAANARHHEVIDALLDGEWRPAAPESGDPLMFFTRREIEKLCYRAGFAIKTLRPVPGPGHAAWDRDGRPGRVRAGRLRVESLALPEAEEFYTVRFLVSATAAAAPDHGTTSVVLVTHNQLGYTRQCLDSIRMYTDEPYEIIVVDNASTDGTPEYLAGLRGVTLVRNGTNRGFPAAANQGLRAARGQQMLLLNNDTVVTTGWLRRMLDALHGDPAVGLVGPCSNRVSGEQQVPVSYDEDLVGLDGFAWEWGQANDCRREDTDRLVGFCLLIRREVIDRVGMLDERFGTGCFEDDDYCLRALRAGYRAVIARDAFVHHYGGRTFVGRGVDFAGLMRHNQALFREKWRPAPAAAANPGPQPPPAPGPFGLKRAPGGGLFLVPRDVLVSLCMIVRDNAGTIGPCLESIRPWVDEMVVVDTGSKDDTPRLAARLGARVFHFPWCDSFSAARNESVRHARGRWVFWMDSDDTISPENGRKLRALAAREPGPGVLGYVMQVHCPGPGDDGDLDMTVVDHVKLFRNLPQLRFEGRIHEQILPAIRRAGGETAWTDVFVTHSGYDHSPEGQERKKQRDLRLLHLERDEQPEHPFTLFNLGMTYADVGEHGRAVEFLTQSIGRSGHGESHLRKAYALLVYCHARLDRIDEAWQACEQGLRLFPEDKELRFREAILLHEAGRLAEAAAAYLKILSEPGERYFTSVDRGIRGFKARQNLALVYADQRDWERAEEQWRLVVREAPRYRPGWRGLGEVLLRQGKAADAAALTDRLAADGALRAEGLQLGGHLAAAAGDFAEARRKFREATAARPDDPELLEMLCRFLFERGEPNEAEAALQALLRVRPHDPAALHNLGTVYVRQARAAKAVEAYRQSVQLRPASVSTWLRLGDALRDVGQWREAAAAWKEAERLDPGNAEAAEALRRARHVLPS